MKYHAVADMNTIIGRQNPFCRKMSSVICSIEEFKSLDDANRCKRCEAKLKKLKLWEQA